jgi:hypothetical protein
MAYINGIETVSTYIHKNAPDVVVPDKSGSQRGTAGLVYMYNESCGLRLDDYKRLCIASANNADIIEKKSVNKPIVPANFAYALTNHMYRRQLSALDLENEEDHENEDMPTSAKLTKAYVDQKAPAYRGNFSDINHGGTQSSANDHKFPTASAVKAYVEGIAAYDGSITEASTPDENGTLPKDSMKPASVWAVANHTKKIKTEILEDTEQSMESFKSDILQQILPRLLNFKMASIEKGGTFTIKPGMLALVLPYGDYTLSAHKADGTEIATGMGTTMIFSAERDEAYDGDYWMAAVYARSAMLTATVSSNHNRYSTDCYIKNNYSGNEGSGMAYVYYLS